MNVSFEGCEGGQTLKQRGGSAGLGPECAAPVVQLLRQNGDPVTEGYVMVSKVAPDQMFDTGDMNFPMPCTSNCDPDTFRPEATGLGPDQVVEFKVEVLPWDGRAVDDIPVFRAISDGSGNYRSERELRLVSNDDPGGDVTAYYDDDPWLQQSDKNRQTILVALEDRVRVTTIVDGVDEPAVEWQVGASAGAVDALGNPDPNAVRRANLKWIVPDVITSTVPNVITSRVSEDFAQASIYFRNVGVDFVSTTLKSVLSIRYVREGMSGTTQTGSISFDVVDTSTQALLAQVNYPSYVVGSTTSTVVAEIQRQLTAAGLAPSFFNGRDGDHSEKAIVIGRLSEVRVANLTFSGDIEMWPYELDPAKFERSQERLLTAAASKDTNDQSIDFIVVEDGSLGNKPSGGPILGIALTEPPTGASSLSIVENTVFVIESAADDKDDYAMVAGHEIGHVLFQETIPGGISGEEEHHPDSRNLMDRSEGGPSTWPAPQVNPNESVSGSKRLTPEQQLHARCMSGPTSDQTTLPCPLGNDAANPRPTLLLPLGVTQQ